MDWFLTQVLNILVIPLLTNFLFKINFSVKKGSYLYFLFSAIFLFYIMNTDPTIYTVYANLVGVGLIISIFKKINMKNVLLSIISFLVYSLIDNLLRGALTTKKEFYSIMIIFSVLVIMTLINRKKIFFIDTTYLSSFQLSLFILFFFALEILISYFLTDIIYPNTTAYKLLFAFFLLCMILIFIFVSISALQKKNLYVLKDKWNQEMLEHQKEYYLTLLEKDQAMRKFKHDLNNHFFVLKSYAKEGDTDKVNSYLTSLIGAYEDTIVLPNTDNHLFNIILSDLYQHYQRNDIQVELEGEFPKQTMLSELDFCTLFSNVLKNAFEAVIELENSHPTIHIKVFTIDGYHSFQIKNRTKNKLLKSEDGHVLSTKKGKNRGIGLKNVLAVVEKYDGRMEMKEENGFFICNIIIKEFEK